MKQIQIEELLKILELEKGDLAEILQSPNPPIKLNEFKTKVEKQRRSLAKKYHPDVGGTDEMMKQINNAADTLLKLQFRPPPVQRQTVIIRTHTIFTSSSWNDGGTYTFYTSYTEE